MADIYEIEIGGKAYEIEADSPQDAASKAKLLEPNISSVSDSTSADSTFQRGDVIGGANKPTATPDKPGLLSRMGADVVEGFRGAGEAITDMPARSQEFSNRLSANYQIPKTVADAGGVVGSWTEGAANSVGRAGGGLFKAGSELVGLGKTYQDVVSGGLGKVGLDRVIQENPKSAEFLTNAAPVAIAPVVKPALNLSLKGLAKSAKVTDKLLSNVSEHLSDVPASTLKEYGWGTSPTAKNIQKYAGKQHEVGNEILEHLDNIDEHLPEKKIVDEALTNMPPVNIGNTVNALLKSKESIAGTPSAVSGNAQIDRMVKTLINAADEAGNISAKDYRKVRIQFDNDVAAAFNKDYKTGVERAGLAARNQIMDDLLTTAESSGNPAYSEAMKEYARKLQLVDKLKGYIGQSSDVRARRIDGFINNLFNANKEDARAAMAGLSEVVGSDLLKKAEYVGMAKQMGGTGKPPLISPVKTGTRTVPLASLGTAGYGAMHGNVPMVLAGLGGFAVSSPAVASKILATTGGIAKGLSRFDKPKPKSGLLAGLSDLQKTTDKARLPLSSENSEALKRMAGLPITENADQSFEGMGPLLSKQEHLASEKLGQSSALPEEAFQDYNPDRLITHEELAARRDLEGMKAATTVGRDKNLLEVSLAEKKKIKNDVFGKTNKEIKLNDLSPEELKKVNEYVHKANSDPQTWNDLYLKGVVDKPHSGYDVQSTEMLTNEDIIDWANETWKPKKK